MNDAIKNMLHRRSFRAYKQEQIKDDDLELILKAGMYAASGNDEQSAVLIAVQNKEDIAVLSKMNADIAGFESDPFYGAPTVVIVVADSTKVTPVEDGTLAIGNLMNAAASLGLGSCWVHREREIFESEEGKAFLKKWGLSGDYIGVGACILGYPATDWPEASSRKEGYTYIIK